MKAVAVIVQIFIFLLLLVGAGCEPAASELPAPTDSSSNLLSAYTAYTPVKIDIMPLTEFATTNDALDASKLKVYVSLLDSFDSQIKSPGVFRFELYEYVQRSAEPKGRRIIIWPDIDLTECSENNNHWRDFLRAYEFNLDCRQTSPPYGWRTSPPYGWQTSLDFGPQRNQTCILQVTCLCPGGKRLSAEFTLRAYNKTI